MNAIIEKLTESKLSELKGLSVEGEISVPEEMLNDLIQLYMKSMHEEKSFQENPEPEIHYASSASPGLDVGKLLASIDEKDVKIHFHEKHAVIKLVARKY